MGGRCRRGPRDADRRRRGLLLGAAPSIASSMFNRGLGFTEQPGRVDVALAFFAEHGVAGEIVLIGRCPSRDRPRLRLDVYVAAPDDVVAQETPDLAIRVVVDDETTPGWRPRSNKRADPGGLRPLALDGGAPRSQARPDHDRGRGRRADSRGRLVVRDRRRRLAELGVGPSGCSRPGIQRALIAARTRLAADQAATSSRRGRSRARTRPTTWPAPAYADRSTRRRARRRPRLTTGALPYDAAVDAMATGPAPRALRSRRRRSHA